MEQDNRIKYTTYTKPENKSWVVFVHGAGGSSKTFGRQISAFKENFNLLLPDLRDHGASSDLSKESNEKLSMDLVAKDVLDVMNDLGIKSAHFVGVSLGSIVIRLIEELEPRRVRSIVTGGGIMRFNRRTAMLFSSAVFISRFIPYHSLYSMVAWILMPRSNHKIARRLFVREALNINDMAFKAWLSIVTSLMGRVNTMFNHSFSAPVLMIMGAEDYAFLDDSKLFKGMFPASSLSIISSSGHLCNLDNPVEFNRRTLEFIAKVESNKDNLFSVMVS